MTDKNGEPDISVPKTDPPTTLQVQPLIKGEGKKVGENDQITFDYRWERWSDGKLLEESYSTEPATAACPGCCPGWGRGSPARPWAVGCCWCPAGRRLPTATPPIGRTGRDAGDGGRSAVHPVAAVAPSSEAACRPAAAAARK